MNEVRALVEAFDATIARGEQCALATLVSVEGSAYRRPGARMLVCQDGTNTGTISAGCLENDVIEHALRVLRTGTAKLVEYNTASTSDEAAWGLGLGCNGIVRLLIEPLDSGSAYIEALRRSCASLPDDASITVATVYGDTPPGSAIGGRLLINEAGHARHENLSGELAAMLERKLRTRLHSGEAGSGVTIEIDGVMAKVFIETLQPPVPLLLFGAGQDALPLIEMAQALGWHTEIIDPQARPASIARFAMAVKVTLARPAEVRGHITITPRTMAILLSHNYAQDLEMLKFLLASPARYIGIMGPRTRTERMLKQLATEENFVPEATDLARLYSPAGLDIGANGPAEIAMSILSEMRAVLAGRAGGMLRERRGTIHGGAVDDEHFALPNRHVQSMAVA